MLGRKRHSERSSLPSVAIAGALPIRVAIWARRMPHRDRPPGASKNPPLTAFNPDLIVKQASHLQATADALDGAARDEGMRVRR